MIYTFVPITKCFFFLFFFPLVIFTRLLEIVLHTNGFYTFDRRRGSIVRDRSKEGLIVGGLIYDSSTDFECSSIMN